MAEPALALDHVVIGVDDLTIAAAALSEVLGRGPSWRGRHPTYGTANVLFRLDNCYLELLAPDANAKSDSAWTGSLGRFLQERGSGLFAAAFATSDVAATVAAARARGLEVEDPADGDGIDLDTRALRRWTNARIPPDASRGTRAFFIQHRSSPEALPPASFVAWPAGVVTAVNTLGIESGDVDASRRMLREAFSLPESPFGDAWRYRLGNADLVLQPGASGEATDRWSLLVCRVGSLAAARERLGVDFEEANYANQQGLLVVCCGANILITEG